MTAAEFGLISFGVGAILSFASILPCTMYVKKTIKMILDLSHSKLTKYLHAQVQVVKFYEKVGFKKIGEKFDEVGIMHYKMILE